MELLSHSSQEKLKSISERLKYLANSKNSGFIDKKIKSENLKYNISYVISHIILKLCFVNRSIATFQTIINNYNEIHKTDLNFKDFEKINWVRIVSEDVVMPEVVRYFVWQVGHYEKEGKPIEIPIDKIHIVRCLQLYYESYFENTKLTIKNTELKKILKKCNSEIITIEFLLEKKIIGKKNNLYYWKRQNQYAQGLRNEIASTLWLLVGGENAITKDFKKYFKLINATEILAEKLDDFLDARNTNKICKLAIEYLNSEEDLIKSDDEFRKIWLDAPSYAHIDINNQIPVINFNYGNVYDFIESVNFHKWRYNNIFDYQKTRSYCYSLLKIIVHSEPKNQIPYENSLIILKDTSKPFLVWSLYREIPSEFPFLIPYLLTELELIPIAFKLIDEIGIKESFLKGQSYDDKKQEERCEIESQLWLEMFDFILEQFSLSSTNEKEKGEIIAKILMDLSEKVFSFNTNDRYNVIHHNALKKRYDKALWMLNNQRIKHVNVYQNPIINPRIFVLIFPHLTNYLKDRYINTFQNHNEFLKLKSSLLDLSIEILRLSDMRFTEDEISEEQKLNLIDNKREFILIIKKYLIGFYSQIQIEFQTYNGETKTQNAIRGVNEFGFEIIDWGYLFLQFKKSIALENLHENFKSTLDFNTKTNKYDRQNKEQFEKIKLYLKSLLLGFISINNNKSLFEIGGFPVKETLSLLEKWIKELCLFYSIDDLPNKRINVFHEMYSVFGYDIYHQHLTSLLYKSINYFTDKAANEFIKLFFESSNDIGRMLTAINILDSKVQQNIISRRISEVKIETFINEAFTTTELQYALTEAVNSENHWILAKPIIDRIQNHFKKFKQYDENWENFLFQVNLLLAFKNKDLKKLQTVEVPKKPYILIGENKKTNNVKDFYIALFKLYNERDYDSAIKILKPLLAEDNKNTRYAFHLYRAETLKAINLDDVKLINSAYKDWENFVISLNNTENSGLSELGESISCNNLYYFIAIKDSQRFDLTINKLSKRYLYDEETIPIVYKFYIERGLHELAFEYLQNAKKYLINLSIIIPENIKYIIENSISIKLLESLKNSLINIRALKARDLPLVTPDIINDKRNLGEFILNEIVQASKVLIDKIHGIKKNPHEDRYNDLLLAILRLRFQIWAWSINDQPRKGDSLIGKDAGKPDITIEAGNITIALFEALILNGKNKSEVQKHISKSFGYAKNLERYYMIIYFKGKNDNFNKTWDSYIEDVINCKFPINFELDKINKNEDLIHNFEDVNHLKIAKSIHGKNVEMYHVFINLS